MSQPPDIDQIVKIIMDEKPVPDWLPLSLSRSVDFLAQVIHDECRERLPGRKKARAELDKIKRRADELAKALTDGRLARLICAGAGKERPSAIVELIALPGANGPLAARRLTELGAWAHAASKGIPAGGGRGAETPWLGPGAPMLAPQVLCAATVCMLWNDLHGGLPGEGNQHATDAMDKLWIAAGEPSVLERKRANGKEALGDGWRTSIKKARRIWDEKKPDRVWRAVIRGRIAEPPAPPT